jgi:hypothetical protein
VKFFSTLSVPATSARVFGSVTHVEHDLLTGESRNHGTVGNIALTLRGSGRVFEARTGPDGRYEIAGVPPGTYQLAATPPAKFAIAFLTCIRGAIVDTEQRPLVDAIVTVTPAALIGKNIFREPASARTDQNGRYELADVPAGRYILGVNLTNGPDPDVVSPTRFHPAATQPADALPFEVIAGEHLELVPMVIPTPPPSYRITGVVTFEDGKPAPGVMVSLADGNARWKQVAADVPADANGTFSFLVHEGLSYVVSARYSEPSTPGRTHSVGSLPFVASDGTAKTLKVVLSPVNR